VYIYGFVFGCECDGRFFFTIVGNSNFELTVSDHEHEEDEKRKERNI